MAYKFTDPNEYGQAHLDPDSCPKFDKLGKAVVGAQIGYEVGKMTANHLGNSGPGRFFKELKLMWDVPNPEQRARLKARNR